jgi:hypothetical protein
VLLFKYTFGIELAEARGISSGAVLGGQRQASKQIDKSTLKKKKIFIVSLYIIH